MRKWFALVGWFVFSSWGFAEVQQGCWFLRSDSPRVSVPSEVRSVLVERFYRIHYPAGDSTFADLDLDGMPDLVQKQIQVFRKSRHLLETELGWRLPATRREAGRAELDVYFIRAGRRFTGTVRQDPGLAILMNRRTLASRDFAALWIHQLAHAAQLQYRRSGEYWFFEATAGWLEGQFLGYSAITLKAQQGRLNLPEVSLVDVNPMHSLGASRFLELVARSNRDVLRQTWDQWSYANELRADEILASVLVLNHMPDLESYLQNYFLLASTSRPLDEKAIEVSLAPYSAAMFSGLPESNSGGARLVFTPEGGSRYATGVLFFSRGEKSGTLALKKGMYGPGVSLIPYSGADHYRFLVVNGDASWLKGKITLEYDSDIPGVLEYFRVNSGDGGVQIEWKTSREEGVAFWNLYRIEGGRKELLNHFPIPAAIQSDQGVRYMYLDTSDASFYSLEAITSEGFSSPLGGAESPP